MPTLSASTLLPFFFFSGLSIGLVVSPLLLRAIKAWFSPRKPSADM
jgi:hypothetical protein